MEDSWENFHLHTELECGDDYFIENYNDFNIDSDDFLREILLQTPLEESEKGSVTVNVNGGDEVVGNMMKSNSSNSIVSQIQEQQQQEQGLKSKKVVVPRRCSSPTSYILSFDNSTMIPATPEPCVNLEVGKRDYCSNSDYSKKNKRNLESSEKDEIIMKINKNQGVKKARSSSQCVDHIMAERKRRQELTERFIALSATIPGLSKTDKASILRAAIDYVKQLQERVHELEEKQDKNKQNGIELKLLDHVENLQLFVTGTCVLPFGKSAMSITIIAQMGDGYKVTVHDLVKSIRQVLVKPQIRCQSDPY
ncbi:hypothetical protein P8452_35268 [Trifolium repens]|nr:hypothetical protein P8452_35268 [Trifolium repens]